MATAVIQKMSLVELVQTPIFNQLTTKQGVFVLTYLQHYLDTGVLDPTAATKAAYDCSSDDNAHTFSYQLLANIRVRRVLDFFDGKATTEPPVPTETERNRETLIAIVRKQLRAAPKGSTAASDFTNQLERLMLGGPKAGRRKADKPEVEPAEVPTETDASPVQKFPIGSVIVQDNKKYRVVAQEIE
jgi:hypothetical protein